MAPSFLTADIIVFFLDILFAALLTAETFVPHFWNRLPAQAFMFRRGFSHDQSLLIADGE